MNFIKHIIPLFFILLISCDQKEENKVERKQFDRLSKQSLYNRELININHDSITTETIEIYISKDKDTFYNQHKNYKNGILDSINSVFYTLKTYKTKNKHIYKGQITLHTKHENLKLDQRNRRIINFDYCIQTKDSIGLIFKKTESKNTIEFEYENIHNDKLQGVIYQIVERDTLVNNKEMVILSQAELLVDNHTETDNLFAESYDIISDNNYSLKNRNLKKSK